jgi:hypothetical protein
MVPRSTCATTEREYQNSIYPTTKLVFYKLHVPSQYRQRTCMEAWTNIVWPQSNQAPAAFATYASNSTLYMERRENLFFWRRRSRFFPPRTSMRRRIRMETCDPSSNPSRSHISGPAFLQQRKVSRFGNHLIFLHMTCPGGKLKNSGTVKQNSGTNRSLCPL